MRSGHQITVREGWGQYPVGPFVIHVAGGQRARQSVVPDRLQGKMFYNRILFSVISFKARIPIVLHIFSDDRGGS